jgi:uncharacterized protein
LTARNGDTGTLTVHTAADGAQVEVADLGSRHARGTTALSAAGLLSVDRLQTIRGAETSSIVTFHDGRASWTERVGLQVRRSEWESDALAIDDAVVFGSGLPLVTPWSALTARVDLDEAGPQRFEAMNLPTGRPISVWAEVRERRRVGDIEAVRLFAWSASEGHSLWLDGETRALLALKSRLGSVQVVRSGFDLPEPLAVEAGGVVETELEIQLGETRLGGILTRPAGAVGQSATVLILHGSGASDRNGDAGGLRLGTYRRLAHAAARSGVNVIRWDKRGSREEHRELDQPITHEDFVADAVAWIDLLRAREGIDPDCFFVMGHSEGGLIAPLVAAASPSVQGLIMLGAGPSSLAELMRVQLPLVLRAHGATEDEIAAGVRSQDALFQVIESGKDKELPGGIFGDEDASAWFRAHLAYDPGEAFAHVDRPLLFLFGAQDLQVPPSEALQLKERFGDSPDVTVRVIDDMDHMLSGVVTEPGMGSYSDPDRPLSGALLDVLDGWLAERRCGLGEP